MNFIEVKTFLNTFMYKNYIFITLPSKVAFVAKSKP